MATPAARASATPGAPGRGQPGDYELYFYGHPPGSSFLEPVALSPVDPADSACPGNPPQMPAM
eukprot:12910136-Prorocentrum_lima.AAC.1